METSRSKELTPISVIDGIPFVLDRSPAWQKTELSPEEIVGIGLALLNSASHTTRNSQAVWGTNARIEPTSRWEHS